MFNPLPTFHCFGLTGGVILPLLQGLKAFQYPSPLHAKQITDLLPQVNASILFATDTFLSQYARVAEPNDFATLKFAVAGAEKVREETRALFNTKFGGVELLEGYGATEASPVIAVNHPDRNAPGTVGQMLPGIDWKLEPVEGIEGGGRLFLKGSERHERLCHLGRAAGLGCGRRRLAGHRRHRGCGRRRLCHHQGARQRFAKIGGEMVSLTAVEGIAGAVWPERRHAVVAIPDSRKGEKLVLVTDHDAAEVAPLAEWARTTARRN